MKRASLTAAFFLAFFLTGCQNPVLTNKTFVMELGSDVYANPSLYIDNPEKVDLSRMEIETKDSGITISDNRFVSASLDYLGVGEYDFVLKDRNREYPFVIKVKDTQPPTIKNAPATLEADLNAPIDWSQTIQADDLSGVYFDAPVGITSTPGEKSVEVKIRDRFGNSVTRTIQVTVK